MTRQLAGPLSLLLAAACSGVPFVSLPESQPSPSSAAPAGDLPVAEAPRANQPEFVAALPDSIVLERIAADSVADAVVLEQLEMAHPPVADTAADVLPALEEAGGLSDIDLTTWADHDRVRYYLDFFQGPARGRMAVWLDRLPVYEPMVRERFAAESLPQDLVYLGLIESGYSNVAVSRSRAVGMWQFMRGTGRWMGLRIDGWVDERRDPVAATDAAARYLRYLTDKFGSVYLAAAAYNGGPGTVQRGLGRVFQSDGPASAGLQAGDTDDEGWTDAHFFTLADTRYLRRETKDYVPKLIAASLIARNPTAYGFNPISNAQPWPRDSIVVPDMTGLDVIAELAGTNLAGIRELNPHYLRLATPPGTPSVVRLPKGTADRVVTGYASLPAEKRIRYREHVVSRGETLSGIASRYRVAVSDIRMANRSVRSSSTIHPGQVLVIPAPGGVSPASARASSATAEAPAARGSSGATTHVVRSGETLSTISRRYGVSVRQLQSWNGMGSSTRIRAGQRLRVGGEPARAVASASPRAQTHLVRRGETLSSLARRYGVSVQALMEANDFDSARDLKAGARIRIPS